MSTAAEYLTAVAALLGLSGGVLRYVLRISAMIERVSGTVDGTVTALDKHVQRSERLADRVEDHGTRIAVLESRPASATRSTAP